MIESVKRTHNRAYLRHQTKRAIKHKERILKEVFKVNFEEYQENSCYVKGKLDKGKVHCSCKMCKYEKHFHIEKHKHKEKKRLMKNEIDYYKKQHP